MRVSERADAQSKGTYQMPAKILINSKKEQQRWGNNDCYLKSAVLCARRCVVWICTNVSHKPVASIFRVEVSHKDINQEKTNRVRLETVRTHKQQFNAGHGTVRAQH